MMEVVIVIKIIQRKIKKFKEPAVSSRRDPFKVLIACILSLRTRDKTTEKATERLFSLASTPEEMSTLSVKQIEKAIYPVGFYKTKARRIKDICKIILKEGMPCTQEDLLKLKGVGRKTANIVMTYGYNNPDYIAVDTHVHRIPNRLGWIKTKKPEQTEIELMKIVPKKYWKTLNDTFVTFGQNICQPVKPMCCTCPVTKYCRYYRTVYLPQSQ